MGTVLSDIYNIIQSSPSNAFLGKSKLEGRIVKISIVETFIQKHKGRQFVVKKMIFARIQKRGGRM